MLRRVLVLLVLGLAAPLLAADVRTPVADSYTTTPFSAQAATGTATSSADRVGSVNLAVISITYAGITGSPLTCTIQLQNSVDGAVFLTYGAAISIAPSSSTTTQMFYVNPGTGTFGAAVKYVYACGTYPSAGTLTMTVFYQMAPPFSQAITDGTNIATVKAASTASVAADKALVVSINPNTKLAAAAATTAAATPSAAVLVGAGSINRGSAPNGTVAGNLAFLTTDPDQRTYVNISHPNYFSCLVSAATAATQCQAAPAASTMLNAVDVVLSNGGTAQTVQLTSGTGSACGTSTANVTPVMNLPINGSLVMHFLQPIRLPAATALCCKPSGATAFSCLVNGWTSQN
jgi:hypothetical protein